MFAVASVFLSFAAPAHASSEVGVAAHPTGCSSQVWFDYGATAACSNHNGGSWRAVAVCVSPTSKEVKWFYGPWKKGGVSLAYCNGDTVVRSAGLESSPTDMT